MSVECKYHVDERQELYAIGTSLVFTGFFPVFPGTNGLGRPLILKECGATTQVMSFILGANIYVLKGHDIREKSRNIFRYTFCFFIYILKKCIGMFGTKSLYAKKSIKRN
jgi:hypothetical protein